MEQNGWNYNTINKLIDIEIMCEVTLITHISLVIESNAQENN